MRRRDRIAKLEAEISFLHLRTDELERIFTDRYGPQLPNNAEGRDCLRIMANHFAILATTERRLIAMKQMEDRANERRIAAN
jgi:hypothetical protein